MYNPNTHLEISRARQADLIREARKYELARRVSPERPGLLERLRGRFASEPARHPAPQPS